VTYTAAAALGVGFALVLDLLVLRTRVVGRRGFWVAYAIILGFELVVDGVLTGRRLVVYDPTAVLGGATPHLLGGWRLGYAPVEDVAFGFSLVVQTVAWWVWWERRERRARTAAGPKTASRRGSGTATRRSRTR
jgi:lycopene cyclase domain-containing protein